MTLALLVPGVGMGGSSVTAVGVSYVPQIHKRIGLWQPDLATVGGPGFACWGGVTVGR